MSIGEELNKRILILDGAMGTMIQRHGIFTENNDLLNIRHPEIIEEIHRQYIEAGADIITTNSFSSNYICQERIGMELESEADEMAFRAASIARKAADSAPRKVFVAGSVGPTGYSLSIATDAGDPSFRKYGFEQMKESYKREISSLQKGGADILLIETCFDALNAKAAIYAICELGCKLPAMISATVNDRSGRLLTGQTLEAFYNAVKHCPNLAAFGINCSFGAEAMMPFVEEICSFSAHPVIFYPNAGLPDEMGNYCDTPDTMAHAVASIAGKGLLNIAGGCCGTTPEHIAAIRKAIGNAPVHRPGQPSGKLTVSGLEAITIDSSYSFTNIGERTNVAGSRKFAKLIADDRFSDALQVAADQVGGGASIIDVNTDDPMLDSSAAMQKFLRYISSDPAVARAAVMIDSSKWDTILHGLRNSPGKCIVNSISLRDGEDDFKRKAMEISRFGAAMVVMAFDEDGQATTYERRTAICARSYSILTSCGIKPEDIIFDCNVLTIGTGIKEHNDFAKDFIEAVRYVKQNLPGSYTSGGISNLSFAFRGNNPVREAMHSAFLYHAIKAGLDMAIVNPQMLSVYDNIEPNLRKCIEDVIFNTDDQAVNRLLSIASQASGIRSAQECAGKDTEASGGSTAEERLVTALVGGKSDSMEKDIEECAQHGLSALEIVEGPLMKGMEKVGELFGSGKMFLPQVVRAAKVMSDCVALLQPKMESALQSENKPRFLIATVQGDVHDIGKNITSIVLQCSGFEVLDLGVMVPVSEIIAKAVQFNADIIGVSGLITPSLSRMEDLCREMAARKMETPLFIGGAATSAIHTALKLAPLYRHVFYGSNSSDTAVYAKKCIADRNAFEQREEEARNRLVAIYGSKSEMKSRTDRPSASDTLQYPDCDVPEAPFHSKISPDNLRGLFDRKLFRTVCALKNPDAGTENEALRIISDNSLTVNVAYRLFKAHREDDTIIANAGGESFAFPMLRDSVTGACLADCFPSGSDVPFGIFAASVGDSGKPDKFDLIRHAAKVTLAESASKWIQEKFGEILKIADHPGFNLIAPGIGYPCCPDHSLKRDILELLPDTGITLTESCAMMPEASVCGFLIAAQNAKYRDIRKVNEEALQKYAELRGFDGDESELYIGFLR